MTAVAVELCVVAIAATFWFYPPAAMFALALAGRSPYCPATDVLAGAERRVRLNAEIQRLTQGSTIVERDPAGYDLWRTPMGDYWAPAGAAGASLPVLLAQQSVDNYGDGELGVQQGDIVLDGGAHIGVYVREALDRGARTVVAIEPAPVHVECLRRNFPEEIADGRVIIYPKGIWDVRDELPLFEDPNNSAADGFLLKTDRFKAKHVIPLVPIDDLVAELGLERVDMIKMDIKGAALRALMGGKETVAKDRPRVVISTEEDGDSPEELIAAIETIAPGYRPACGSCSLFAGWLLSPDVLLLEPTPAPSRAAADRE